MTPVQEELVARLRDALAAEPVTREVSMFGGRSFMVNDKMVVSALKDGGLLVRVAAEQHDALLERPGAVQAEMGQGRDMGAGWIHVAAEAVSDQVTLAAWLELALAHNRALTAARLATHAATPIGN